MRAQVEKLIFDVIKEMNSNLENKIPLNDGNSTPLFGEKGILDSLGLVSVIVSVEEKVEDEFGVHIVLADERAISQKHSPFRTIGSLGDYIAILIEESTNG